MLRYLLQPILQVIFRLGMQQICVLYRFSMNCIYRNAKCAVETDMAAHVATIHLVSWCIFHSFPLCSVTVDALALASLLNSLFLNGKWY